MWKERRGTIQYEAVTGVMVIGIDRMKLESKMGLVEAKKGNNTSQ